MLKLFSALVVALLLLVAAPVTQAVPPGTFSRMFPKFEPVHSTDQQLIDLAATMLDNGSAATDQPVNGRTFVEGQFLDHDCDRDNEPSPTAVVNIRSLDNERTCILDLDSVYGDGPQGTPALYEADGKHLRVGAGEDGVTPDVPRDPDGTAVLGDGRNDENLVIAQLHAGFLRAHNRLVDQGLSFADARKRLTQTWQWLVYNQFLPTVTDSPPRLRPNVYEPGNKHDPVVPVEFAVAAFRYGHSQPRNTYRLNTTGQVRRIFSFDLPDLRGGRRIPADAGIEWSRFFDIPRLGATPPGLFNRGKLIDTQLSQGLFELPASVATRNNALGFLNMVRARHYSIPSYEDVARELGVTPVAVPEARAVGLPETPLWFGILQEAEDGGGQRLGPTAARIVNEVFRTNIERDPNSFLRQPGFVPVATSIGGLLDFAGVVRGPF